MGYKKDWGSGSDRPFNFAQLLLERLDLLFRKANEARVDATPFLWYKVLATIKTTISFILVKNDEEDELENLNNMFKKIRGSLNVAREQNSEAFYLKVEQELDTIETEIIRLMYKYQLYYPQYSSKSWEEKAMEEDM